MPERDTDSGVGGGAEGQKKVTEEGRAAARDEVP